MNSQYFDTGVALKLVVEEPLSPVVRGLVERRQVPAPFSRLIEMEIENVLQALLFQQEITGEHLAGALADARAVRMGPLADARGSDEAAC